MSSDNSVGNPPGGGKDTKFVPPWQNLTAKTPWNDPEEKKKRKEAEERLLQMTEADKFRAAERANIAAEKASENQVEIEKLKLKQAEVKAGDTKRPQADPSAIILRTAMNTDTTTVIYYIFDPYFPLGQVIGNYGRGGTGKSSFVATLAAHISWQHGFGTLWVSTEEPEDWIRVRHIAAGGRENTLHVVQAVVTEWDASGRPIASTFDVYAHLEPAIKKAQMTTAIDGQPPAPLKLVVLDTAVALTKWGPSENSNSDGGVKRLMATLKNLAEQYGLCIVVIGHSNKGQHDQLSDTVAGARAWTDSPRQAFVHLRDQRGNEQFVIVAVKHSLTGPFAQEYITDPVHTLRTRADGVDSVLCKVIATSTIQWGYSAAEQLASAAQGKDREDGSQPLNSATRKNMSIDEAVTAVSRFVGVGVPNVTRKDVEKALGRKVSKRHWQEIDDALVAHGIARKPIDHGEFQYYRASNAPAAAKQTE